MITKKTTGFTLIELMLVLAIIGILATIAYPQYQESVKKSRRTDAKGALMGFAGAMERYFTVANHYTGAAVGSADTGVPRVYATQSPIDGTEKYYDLTIADATATTFTLYATPTGKQATDRCGTLTLTNTGVRDIKAQTAGVTKADCW
jgi:type IV pilus assembly protein PilE